MKCPVCQSYEGSELHLHSEGFNEGIHECKTCNTVWSVNHNLAEVINDPQAQSFLSALSETVEADDYCWVA